jgi:hypothetical protein
MQPVLFDYQRPLAGVLAQARERISSEVNRESESYVRDADAEQWAAHLAEKYAADPPAVIEEGIKLNDLGEREVDATGMPGVSYTTLEWGRPIIRPGREFQLVIPTEGAAALLQYGPSGGAAVVEAAVMDHAVYRHWLWPLVRGSEALDAEVQEVISHVRNGAQRVAAEVVAHNAGLASAAMHVIETRRAELAGHSDFLSGLTVPVARREDAPKPFALAPIERRRPRNPLIPKPEPVSGPALGKFYEEILEVVRSMGRAMERTPADFSDREEEHLRDHLLVALNTQYRGQAGAESFNKNGKTDLLLRVQDHNAFIAECKWWSGVKDMGRALDQLYGYSTWRDSRLVLIFFVRAKDPAAIVEKAREALAERVEFDGWQPNDPPTELRCRLRWPEDAGRTATLTVLFFHLPAAR